MPNRLNYGAGSYAVTLPGDGNPYVISADTGDTFTLNSGWQLATDGQNRTVSGAVTFNADGSINVPSNTLTFSGSLGGGYGFTKTGDGMLTLTRTYNLGAANGQNATIAASAGKLNLNGILYAGTVAGGTGNLHFDGNADVTITRDTNAAYYALGLGIATGSTGNVTLADNAKLTLNSPNGNNGTHGFFLGVNGSGSYTQTGGTFSLPVGNIYMACGANSTGTMNVSGGNFNAGAIFPGWVGTAEVNFFGTSIATLTGIHVGNVGTGVTNIYDNADITVTGNISTSYGAGQGTLNVSDNSTLTVNGTAFASFKGSNMGRINISGNATVTAREMWTDYDGTAVNRGTITLADNASLSVTNTYLVVGRYGSGTFNMTGGELSVGGTLFLANQATSTGFFNASSGVAKVTGATYVGERGVGKLHVSGDAKINLTGQLNIATGNAAGTSRGIVYQTGGTVNANGGIAFNTGGNAAEGAYYLAGGTLNTSTIAKPARGTHEFIMTGGTLNAKNIEMDITQYGGTLSPGGTGDLDKTTISSAYVIGENPTPGVSHVNVAYRGIASQSSTNTHPASNAFNGDMDDFSHTGSAVGYHWLQVDLGDSYEIAKVDIYNRTGFDKGGQYNDDRITNSGYYIEVANDEASLGTNHSLTKENVWTSDVYTTYNKENDYSRDLTTDAGYATTASGQYLRFSRDETGYVAADGHPSLNMSELEVYVVEDIVPNVLHIDITADGRFDELLFGAGGSLSLGGDVFLEIGFVGEGAAGDYQVLNDELLAMLNSNSSSFAGVLLSTPGWEIINDVNLMSTGFVTLGASTVPEPATWVMLLLGALGLCVCRKSRK